MVDQRLIYLISVAKPTRAIISPYNGLFTKSSTASDIVLLFAKLEETKYAPNGENERSEPVLACAKPSATLGLLLSDNVISQCTSVSPSVN